MNDHLFGSTMTPTGSHGQKVQKSRKTMKMFRPYLGLLTLIVLGALSGCSGANTRSPDVADSIRKSLDQAGLKDVSVSQDRDKGVVALGGHVASDAEKSQAESITKSLTAGQVVANQIAVLPPGVERDTKAVNSDLDKGIEKNLEGALIHKQVVNELQVKNQKATSSK
jgi:osmotically-inducible protein OsmY